MSSEEENTKIITRLEGSVEEIRNRVDKNEKSISSNWDAVQEIDRGMIQLTSEIKNLAESVQKMVGRVDQQTSKNEADLESLSGSIVEALEDISSTFQESNKSLTEAAKAQIVKIDGRVEKMEDRVGKLEKKIMFWAGGLALGGLILGLVGRPLLTYFLTSVGAAG